MRAGSDHFGIFKTFSSVMLLKHYNHYENRKNVKVYPLLILKYLLATSMQDRISEEMGEFFIYGYYF